jgi:hypothetical protein
MIFARLPVDTRLRCAEVCRGWRTLLSERSLWTALDMTPESGVVCGHDEEEGFDARTVALLRAASARAGGGLRTLDVSRCAGMSVETLRAVVTANAGALREVRASEAFADAFKEEGQRAATLEELLRAAPLLRALYADAWCEGAAALRMLCGEEAPFGPAMRLRIVRLRCAGDGR